MSIYSHVQLTRYKNTNTQTINLVWNRNRIIDTRSDYRWRHRDSLVNVYVLWRLSNRPENW